MSPKHVEAAPKDKQQGTFRRYCTSCKHSDSLGLCSNTPILIPSTVSSSEISLSDGSSQVDNRSDPYPCTWSGGQQLRKTQLKRKFDALSDSEGQIHDCHSEAENAQEMSRKQTIRDLKEERRVLRRILRSLREECCLLEQFKQDEVQSSRLLVSENRRLETRLRTLETRLECKICQDSQIDCATYCGHAFCQDCVQTWYRENSHLCPICRDLMGDEDSEFIAHKLFI